VVGRVEGDVDTDGLAVDVAEQPAQAASNAARRRALARRFIPTDATRAR